MWPEDLDFVLEKAEEVTLEIPLALRDEAAHRGSIHRKALRVRLPEETCARLWPLAEARYRLSGRNTGKAITLIANNPHYHNLHPADGGSEENVSDSGKHYTTRYLVVHFLLDDVRETADSA
ncbi:hypothetical protein [Gellertiella hungarica]|nr:hypothetical protein [Gellertiella hungarica]